MADKKNDIEELPEFEELLALDDPEKEAVPDAVESEPAKESAKDPGGRVVLEEITKRDLPPKESAELRVVEEEEPAEVVRLEESREEEPSDPSKKVKARGDREFLNTMMNDGSVEPLDGASSNPHLDDEWMGKEPARGGAAVPMGWFILVIGFLGLIVCWAGYQLAFSEKKKDLQGNETADQTRSGSDDEFPLGKTQDDQERKEAAESYAQLEEALTAYYAAETIEEKLKYVRYPDRVEPLMRDYYSRAELEPKEYRAINEFHILSLDNRPFIALSVKVGEDEMLPLLAEKTPDRLRFDWESAVAYQPMSIEEFIEKRPAEAMDFRVYVTQDNYFSYEFQDESQWLCYKLTERDGEQHLFGYLPITEAEAMKKILSLNGSRGRIVKPMILKLRFPKDGKGSRSVFIDAIVSERWAYVKDPDEK